RFSYSGFPSCADKARAGKSLINRNRQTGPAPKTPALLILASGDYQRPRPPPPPPPYPPPPPERGRSSRGLASLTVRERPFIMVPLRELMAASASDSFSISTNPKPLDCPL